MAPTKEREKGLGKKKHGIKGKKPIEKAKTKCRRQYEHKTLVAAASKVREQNITLYKASKEFGVPWSTLKDFLAQNYDVQHSHAPKLGRPFALTAEVEQRVYQYIIEMQELGFGLTVLQIRKLAYDLAKATGREKYLNPEKGTASKCWWSRFKTTYNLTLRVPENLSAYRASMANPTLIKDCFCKLDGLLTKLGIKDNASRIWNVDETGISYVVKAGKVVTKIGKRFVYKRTYGEHAETHTLVGCACADGSFLPPFVIFKGVRWNEDLAKGSLPESKTKLSSKGWINSELFIEWFQFFIDCVPAARPLVLLLDSHSSHITPEVLQMARNNGIYLFTFPAHTSHLLQPLDVGVYRSLKSHWNKELNAYMLQHALEKPSRYNFYEIFNPAFLNSFTCMNLKNAFKKAGACPLNYDAVSKEAYAPSKLTDTRLEVPESSSEEIIITSELNTLPPRDVSVEERVDSLLKTPKAQRTRPARKRKGDSSAKCHTPPEEPVAGPSTTNKDSDSEDWVCGNCHGKYSADVKKCTGAAWIQCSFCVTPYHIKCQNGTTDDDVYMCDNCAEEESVRESD